MVFLIFICAGKMEPHGFNMGYLVSPYPYTNGGGAGLPVSMVSQTFTFTCIIIIIIKIQNIENLNVTNISTLLKCFGFGLI